MSRTRSGPLWALAAGAGFFFIYTAVNSAANLEKLKAPIAAVSRQDYQASVKLLQQTDLDSGKEQDKDRAGLILGYCYFRLADYENARTTLLKGLRPSSLLKPYRLYYAAHSCYEQGQHEASAQLFQKLIEDQPSESLKLRSLFFLSYSRVAIRDYPGAKQGLFMLEKLPGIKSAWKPDILYLRAEAEKGLDNPEAAEALQRKLWIDYPLSKYAHLGQGYSYDLEEKLARVKNLDAVGERNKALSELNPLIEDAEARKYDQDRLIELYRLRASIYLLLRRYAQAAQEIERLEKLVKTTDLKLLYDKAKALSRLDRDSDAISIYRQIWQNHPQSTLAPHALHRAGRLYQLSLEHGEAIRTFKELARNYPDHELARDALFQIGWIYYLKRKFKKAYEYLDKIPVLENEPAFNSRTLYWRARALERLGNKNKARKIDQSIITLYPYTCYACFLKGYFPEDPKNRNPLAKPNAPPDSTTLPQPPPEPGARLALASELVLLGLWQDATEEFMSIEDKAGLSESEVLATARLYEQTRDYFRSHRLVYNRFSDRLEKSLTSYPEHARLAYPLAYADLVEEQARTNDLDPFLIMAVIYAESRYKPDVRSSAGALGLMQLMPATAKRVARELEDQGFHKDQLTLPEVNLRYGCYHLAKLITEYQAEKQDKLAALVHALASYNAGKKQVSAWNKTYEKFNLTPEEFIEVIPFTETRIYIRKVLRLYAIYRTIYPQGFPSQAEK
jgi:soluble lytic murein transglycosylase